MNIENAASAIEYVQAWKQAVGSIYPVSAAGNVRRFRRAAQDLMVSVRIMLTARERYSVEQIADLREAVSMLRLEADRLEQEVL